MNRVTGVLHGGCQCGAVRYQLTTDNLVCYACHCLECQGHTTSAFAISVPVRSDQLNVTGKLAAYQRSTASGNHTNCWFCSDCGTRIYHQSSATSEVVTLKGGTLDDRAQLSPIAHLWASRKAAWLVLPDSVPAFETQPDDLKAWRDSLITPCTR